MVSAPTCIGRKTSRKIYLSPSVQTIRGKDMSFHLPLVDTTQFLLRKFLELKWTPQFLMDGTKIISMIEENLHIFWFF